MKTPFVALCLCLLPVVARGQVSPTRPPSLQNQMIYVDPVNGTAAGARGTDKPFPDLASALAVAQPYDHIIMRPGVYSCSGTTTVNTAHLTIEAYGAKMVAASQSVCPIVSIAQSDCHLVGMEIDGQLTSTTNVDSGAIDITAPRTTLDYCYIHDSVAAGVRLVIGWDGTTIQNCTMVNCTAGVQEYLYGNADVTGLNVLYNTMLNNRGGGVRGTNNSQDAHAVYNEKIIGNTVIGNDPLGAQGGGLGIELWGGGIAGGATIPHQNAIVSENYVSGYLFGISMNACGYCEVSHNQVVAGAFCGIEFANSLNCTGAENIILCPLVANNNGYGGGGYGVSNNYGDLYKNVGLVLRGGRIFMGSPNYAIHLYNLAGVTIDGVQIESSSCAVYSQICSQVTVKNTTVFMHNSSGQFTIPLQNEVYGAGVTGTGWTGFHYVNNQIIFDNPSAASTIISFWASAAAPVNGLEIADNYTNATNCNYGFVSLNNVTVSTAKQGGNTPASSVNTLGFVDLTGSGNATTLQPQTNAPAAPATPGAVTIYVDASGDLHALHSNGADHILSYHQDPRER